MGTVPVDSGASFILRVLDVRIGLPPLMGKLKEVE